MKKWIKVSLVALAGIFLLVAITLVSIHFALKSPSMQQKIVASLKAPLKSVGVEVKFDALSVDVFGDVYFANLDANIDHSLAKGTLRAKEFRLGYSLWSLLRQNLTISSIVLTGVQASLSLDLSQPAPPPPPADPDALRKILALIESPPASLSIPSAQVNDSQFDITLKLPSSTNAKTQLVIRQLSASIGLTPGQVNFGLQSDMDLGVKMNGSTNLATTIRLAPDLKLGLSIEDKNLTWSVTNVDSKIRLGSTNFKSGPMKIDLTQADVTTSTSLRHTSKLNDGPLSIIQLLFPLTIKGGTQLNFGPFRFTQASQRLAVTANAQLNQDITIPADLRSFEDYAWNIDQRIQLEALELKQNNQLILATDRVELRQDGVTQSSKGRLTSFVESAGIRSVHLKKPISLKVKQSLELDKQSAELTSDIDLGSKKIWTSLLKLNNSANMLDLSLDGNLRPDPGLHYFLPQLKSLDQIGWPSTAITLKATTDAIGANFSMNDILNKTLNSTFVVTARPQTKASVASFEKLSVEGTAKFANSQINSDLKLLLSKFSHAALKAPAQVELFQKISAETKNRLSVTGASSLAVNNEKLLDLNLKAQETSHKLDINLITNLDVAVTSLNRRLLGIKNLPELGKLNLSSKTQVKMRLPSDKLAEVRDFHQVKVDFSNQSQLSQQGKNLDILWPRGAQFKIDGQVYRQKLDLHQQLALPLLVMKDQAQLKNLQNTIRINVNNITSLNNVGIRHAVKIGPIELLRKELTPFRELLETIDIEQAAQISQGLQNARIQRSLVKVNGDLFQVSTSGQINLKQMQGGIRSDVTAKVPNNFGQYSGSGLLQMPVDITLFDAKTLALKATPKFQNLNLRGPDLEVVQLNGKMDISEEIRLTPKLEFLFIESQNPFARVDFENIDPYLDDANGFRLRKARFKHYEIGPLAQNVEIRQNLILLNELKADSLQGSVLGKMFIDMHPSRLKLGFLGRFSGINPELLKEPSRRRNTQEFLSGRMSTTFDIRKRLATGRVDVTSIGQNQLLSLIDVLDPEFKDPQMMNARRGLQIAYPKLVAIAMDQGKLDFSVTLGGALSSELSIRSVPLTPLINANAGDLLLSIENLIDQGGVVK